MQLPSIRVRFSVNHFIFGQKGDHILIGNSFFWSQTVSKRLISNPLVLNIEKVSWWLLSCGMDDSYEVIYQYQNVNQELYRFVIASWISGASLVAWCRIKQRNQKACKTSFLNQHFTCNVFMSEDVVHDEILPAVYLMPSKSCGASRGINLKFRKSADLWRGFNLKFRNLNDLWRVLCPKCLILVSKCLTYSNKVQLLLWMQIFDIRQNSTTADFGEREELSNTRVTISG